MTYKVSVLRGTKLRPELVGVTDVIADRFEWASNPWACIFYNDETNWLGNVSKSSIVAFLPGADWVVEQG